MKKIILSIFCFIFSYSIFAKTNKVKLDFNYKTPVFEKENSIVIDSWEIFPNPKDNVKINASYNVKGKFNIYVHNPELNEWKDFGVIEIFSSDTTQVLKTKEKPLLYRYIAISAEEKFDYEPISKNNDLVIKVSKKEDSLVLNGKTYSNYKVIDYRDADVEDNIRFENNTDFSNFNVRAFVFDRKQNQWMLAAAGHLKSNGDTDKVSPVCKNDIDSYHFMALVIDGKDFNFDCNFYESHNDLCIQIESQEKPKEDIKISDSKDDDIKIPYEFFHFSYEKPITNMTYAFGNAKIWIAESFKFAPAVIQIEDKDSGTIVGKGIDTWSFTFKIKLRDGVAKVEFYDYYYEISKEVKLVPETNKQFESLKEKTSIMAQNLFRTIENE